MELRSLNPSSQQREQAKEVLADKSNHPPAQGTNPNKGMNLNIDQRPDIKLQQELWQRWHFPITVPASARPDFFMVASFGRCKFRLTPESVGNLLDVCLGGNQVEFRVILLRDRTFRFSVTNKLIGFHIAKLASFTCSNFVVYFHLWGFGGSDYIREFYAWEREEQQLWESPKKHCSPRKTDRSYAQVTSQAPDILTGANAIPIVRQSAFTRLEALAPSPPLSPWTPTKEMDLADCGYAPQDIQQCKEAHIAKLKRQQKEPVPIATVFQRLQLPATSTAAPAPEKTVPNGNSRVNHHIQVGGKSGSINPLNGHNNGKAHNDNSSLSADTSGTGNSMGRNKDTGLGPTCSRCLKEGHHFTNCNNAIHCRFCLIPGHIYRFCRETLASLSQKSEMPKWQGQGDGFPSSAHPAIPKPQSATVATKSVVGEASSMANYAIDLAPLLPGRFDIIDVPGRPQQCGYHVIGHLPAKNEDVAIVNLVPPPNPDAPFHVTRDRIVDLLDGHLGIRIDHMQRSSLGHAIVRLVSTSDRAPIVLDGPHQHNGVQFIFTEHNRGIDWRSFSYNQEVWLMLLNLPLDLWILLIWDKTVSNLTRAIVKVRVEALANIPFSLQFSHGNDFNAKSWTIPIYILSQRLMGLEAPEEQDPPDDENREEEQGGDQQMNPPNRSTNSLQIDGRFGGWG
ncbi:hypothetical protein BRADI_5g02903v3, partial [Brachypodium distachyon]